MSPTLYILLLLLQNHVLNWKTMGLTLPLIHPESPKSPVFDSNLTYEQRVKRLIHQSTISSVANSKFSNYVQPDSVRPMVGVQNSYYYFVQVGIGTLRAKPHQPSFLSYYLLMDTGSDLTWMQCEGCRGQEPKCFPQEGPIFPNSQSATYSPLPCNKHSLCIRNKCFDNFCSYDVRYLDNTYSTGILAFENFAFDSHDGQTEVVKFVFGCGFDNWAKHGDKNRISGVMGLGSGKHSIISQATSHTEGRFSYCFPVVNKYNAGWPITYLRFGQDIIKRPNVRTTPFKHVPGDVRYYLDLQGISINQERLGISNEVFKEGNDGSGGCIIDSGLVFSRIIQPAYIVLQNALKDYFEGQRNLKPYKGLQGFNPCYEHKRPDGFRNLPSMTFHFLNADLVLQPEAVFIVLDKGSSDGGEYFCLAIMPDDSRTSLGSYQQTNHRFIYDIIEQKLLFSPDDCSHDA